MSPQKLFKWLFDIKEAGHTNRIRESFLLLDLFSLTFKNIFSGPLTGWRLDIPWICHWHPVIIYSGIRLLFWHSSIHVPFVPQVPWSCYVISCPCSQLRQCIYWNISGGYGLSFIVFLSNTICVLYSMIVVFWVLFRLKFCIFVNFVVLFNSSCNCYLFCMRLFILINFTSLIK